MKDNRQSPLGLKILIEKHHHFIFKFLVALLQTSLAYWFSELQQLRHGCWSLKAPFPLSYLFPILRLHCFSSSSSSHCTFHCKTASPKPSTWAFYFPGLFCSLGFFFFLLSSSFLPVWLLLKKTWLGDITKLSLLPASKVRFLKIQGPGPQR